MGPNSPLGTSCSGRREEYSLEITGVALGATRMGAAAGAGGVTRDCGGSCGLGLADGLNPKVWGKLYTSQKQTLIENYVLSSV